MKVAVFGSGAVGGYFGGRLAEAGEQVCFIARGAHLAALRTKGLKIESPEGDVQLSPVTATDDPGSVGPVDLVLLGTKAWQVPTATQAMGPMMGPDTAVVPLQNGVEAPLQIAEGLGKQHALGGLCRIMSRLVAPGHIQHRGIAPTIVFGELDNRVSARVRGIQSAFARCTGVDAQTPPDIHAAMWRKFLFISALSGLGAVSRAPMGVLRSQPETRRLIHAMLEEIRAVGLAHGIALPRETIHETMTFLDRLPAEGTTSMQRDIAEGRPSELEYQNGAVVWLGQQTSVATPINDFVYSCLLPLERRARNELVFPG